MKRIIILLFIDLFISMLAAQEPELVLQVGHMGDVNTISFSRDGKYIVTASHDKTVKIWEVKSGKLFRTLNGHNNNVLSAVFSPDSKTLCTVSEDNTAKLWDAATGQVINSIEGKMAFTKALPVISPDVKSIAMISDSDKADSIDVDSLLKSYIRVLDIKELHTGNTLQQIRGHIDDFESVSFNPDGRFLVAISGDATIRVWNVTSGELIYSLPGQIGIPDNSLRPVFSQDGRKFATTGGDMFYRIRDFSTGRLICTLKSNNEELGSASFSADGKMFATLSYDNAISIWDAGSGKLLKKTIEKNPGLTSVSFTPDEKNIFLASRIHGYSYIREILSDKVLYSIEGGSPYAFSPDGRSIATTSNIPLVLASATQDGNPKIWDLSNGRLLHSLKGATSYVSLASFSPDGKNVVTNSWDWTAKIWDLQYGKLKYSLAGHGQDVKFVQYSPDGSKVITVSYDKTAKVWDTGNGKLLFTVYGRKLENSNPEPFSFIFFSPNGRKVAAAMTYSDTVSVYDAESGKILTSLKAPGAVIAARFSPNGEKLILESGGSAASVWDVESGNLLYNLEVYDTVNVNDVTNAKPAIFSPDGKNIMTFPSEQLAEVRAADGGELLFTIDSLYRIPENPFSQDGKYIAAIRNIKTDYDPALSLGIYDVPTGKLIRSIDYCLHCESLSTPYQFSFDGSRIIFPGTDETLQLWDIAKGELQRKVGAVDFGVGTFVIGFFADGFRFIPGNNKLLLAECQGEIKILDIVSGKVLKSIKSAGTFLSNSVTFCPDGTRFLTYTEEGDAEIWDAGSQDRIQKLNLQNGKTVDPLSEQSLTFSNDGKRLLIVSGTPVYTIWDVKSGKALKSLKQEDGLSFIGPFSPDGTKILASVEDGSFKIWDIDRQAWLPKPELTESWVRQHQFSPDNKKLLIGIDSAIKIFDVQTGDLLLTITGSADNSKPAAFSPDGGKIMFTDIAGFSTVWNANDGTLLCKIETVRKKYMNQSLTASGGESDLPVDFTPDGKKILSGSDIRDAADGSLLFHLSGSQSATPGFCFSSDSKKLATNQLDESETIQERVWDEKEGKLLQDHTWRAGNKYFDIQKIKNIQLSPDQKSIMTISSGDNNIEIRNAETGEIIRRILCGESKPVYNYFSPDGKGITAWIDDGTIRTWDTGSWEITETKEWPVSLKVPFFESCIDSVDGKKMASFSAEGNIEIWDIQSLKSIRKLEGHLNNCLWASFSPDASKMIAAESFNDTVRLWDVGNGELLNNLYAGKESSEGDQAGLGSLFFSPDGTRIIASKDNIIKIWDSESRELLQKLSGQTGISPIAGLSVIVSPDSRLILSSSDENDTAKIWDLRSGKLLLSLASAEKRKKISENISEPMFRPISGIRAANFSSDSKRIRIITEDGTAMIWDALNGKLLESSRGEVQGAGPATIASIFSPDYMKIVSFIRTGTVLIWEVNEGQWTLNRTLEGNSSPVIAARFLPDNNLLFVAYADSTDRIWDVQSSKVHSALSKTSGYTVESAFSPDGLNLVVFLSDSTAKIWDIQRRKWTNDLEGRTGKTGRITFSSDNKKLLVVNPGDNSAKIWDLGNGKLVRRIEGVFGKSYDGEETAVGDISFSHDGSVVAAASLKPYDFNRICTTLWNLENGEALQTLDGFILNDKRKLDGFNVADRTLMNVPFSPDNKKLVTVSDGGITKIWNAQTGKVSHVLDPHDGSRQVNATVFSPDGAGLLVSSYKFRSGSRLFSDFPVEIWDPESGKLMRRIDFRSAPPKDINWKDSKIIYSFNSALSMFSLKTGKEILSFASINTDDYVFILPSGEYSGTPEGIKNLTWRLGDRLYNFDQWDLQYNRPDKVLEQLGNPDTALIKMYRKAYLKRLKRAGFTEEMFTSERHTPGIRIENYNELSGSTDQPLLNLKISASDSKYKLDRFNVWVNDVPIYGANGVSLVKENADSIVKTLTIPLSGGNNEIKVSCMNDKGVESLKESVDVSFHPASPIKPDLYVIALSVSSYKDKRYNLQYAVKDGRDLASLFSSVPAEKAGYSRIIVDTLFNSSATRENFFRLRDKLLATHIDDQVVLFVSGHGLLDGNMDFYFASYDIDFNKPERRGISFDDLEDLLDSIPARKKLMMMDACHSGEVDKEEQANLPDQNVVASSDISFRGNVKEYSFKGVNSAASQSGTSLNSSFDLMQELFTSLDKGTGTTVISAAAGKGYALESPQWNNGVFTYTIINGLKNKAADRNKDGNITISELKDYSIKEVEILTGGKQKPTARRESINYDWSLWQK